MHAIELGEDMAEILRCKCTDYPNISVDVASFEEWNCPDNRKYDMIYSAQAFHWIDKNIKYKKCHGLLKDDGYLVLFWYNTCNDAHPAKKEIDKYILNYSADKGRPERLAHSGVSTDDEREAEIIASGLFKPVEKIQYTQETRNNAAQYLKAIKSVPVFMSILDCLDEKLIEEMDSKIEEIINSYGGYISTLFNFSLYITKKI